MDTIVVGNILYEGERESSGVHVFRWDGRAWNLEALLLPPDWSEEIYFGQHVAISGDTILVSGHHEVGELEWIGRIHVFERAAGTWVHRSILRAPNEDVDDHFGADGFAIDGDVVVTGVAHEDSAARGINVKELEADNSLNVA